VQLLVVIAKLDIGFKKGVKQCFYGELLVYWERKEKELTGP